MANEEAERETLMRRAAGSWSSGNGNTQGNNAAPLSNVNPRTLQFQQYQQPSSGQPAMQPSQLVGNALQHWRLNTNEQQQPPSMSVPVPTNPLVYTAQKRPPAAPFETSAGSDAAAAAAAARNRFTQNPRADASWKTLGARPQLSQPLHLPSMPFHPPSSVRPPQTFLGPQMPTPYPGQVPHSMLKPPYTGSPPPPSRPSLLPDYNRFAYPGDFARPPVPPIRPGITPTTPIAFPGTIPSKSTGIPTTTTAARPGNSLPTSLNASANIPNMFTGHRLPGLPNTFTGIPVNLQTTMPCSLPSTFSGSLPSTFTSNLPQSFPNSLPTSTFTGSFPTIGSYQPTYTGGLPTTMPGCLPTTMTGNLPTTLAGSVPSTLSGNLPTTATGSTPSTMCGNISSPFLGNMTGNFPGPETVPSGLLRQQLGMGWPDMNCMPPPAVHPMLVRSSSAPPVPPPNLYTPPAYYLPLPAMPDLSGLHMSFPAAPEQGYGPCEQFVPAESRSPNEALSPGEACGSKSDHGKEDQEATGRDPEEEQKQRQRPVSADNLAVRRRASACHGDAEGRAHRRHVSASHFRPHQTWSTVVEAVRSGPPNESADEDLPTHARKFVVSSDPELDPDPKPESELQLKTEFELSEQLSEKESVVKPAESSSRALVLASEFGRHPLVEDTVEITDEGLDKGISKHRKVALRCPRRRMVSGSGNQVTSTVMGRISPAITSSPESNPNESRSCGQDLNYQSTETRKSPDDGACGEGAENHRQKLFFTSSFFPPFPSATFTVVMSLQYAKLVIVLGLVLPVSELLSPYIRPYSYQAFYLYLYLGSILFMMYINISAAWRRRVRLSIENRKGNGDAGGSGRVCQAAARLTRLPRLKFKRDRSESEDVRYGSIYLRLGVNCFGIGSMVYCGLEIAREIEQWTLASSPHPLASHVDRPVRLLLPACRAVLTILQMHFILFNEKASEIRRQRTPARIGLAHMIATNVCEWLGVVVQETRHEIIQLSSMGVTATTIVLSKERIATNGTTSHPNSTIGHESSGIVGPLLHTVSPLLSPCTIEYSLICAVLLFEMWKEVGQGEDDGASSAAQESQSVSSAGGTNISDSPIVGALATIGAAGVAIGGANNYPTGNTRQRGAHHLSADLTHSQRGAFLGVLLLVLTLLGVALLSAQRSVGIDVITDPAKASLIQLPYDAVLEAILSSAVLLAVVVVAFSTRKLVSDNVPAYPLPLDLFLLVAAQTYAYIYSLFVIIGCYVLLRNSAEPTAVHTHAAVIMGVEALSTLRAYAQTHIIVRAWHRRPTDARQAKDKPGRQAVTFLLFANLCLWTASTFGSARAQRLPHHMRMFGVLPWTAIAHACLPLTIFLHLHSSICLFELWKNCYKFRPD